MIFSGATRRGAPTGSNEDWYAIASGLLVLLDGATMRTETGCRHGAAWYVRQLGARLVAEANDRTMPLDLVLATAIQQVSALHPECDLQHPGSPSAAVALIRIDGDTSARYLVLGDVTIVVETADDLFTITDQRVSETALAERRDADRFLIGTPEKSAALVRMKHAELAAKNTDGGYWIAGADPNAVGHALTGHLDLTTMRQLAVLTDGAARIVDTFKMAAWSDVLEVIEEQGPTALIHRVRTAELHDSLGAAFPRNKMSDDATILHFIRDQTDTRTRPHSRRDIVVTNERAAAIQSIVDRFQNDPKVMGAEPPYRDLSGAPCLAEQSPHWEKLQEYIRTPGS